MLAGSPISLMVPLVILFATFAASALLTSALKPWIQIPVPVASMLLGLMIGPGALRLINASEGGIYISEGHPFYALNWMAWMGVVVLFFISGYETDFSSVTARSLLTASGAWLLCLVLAVGAGFLVASTFAMDSDFVHTSTAISGVFIGSALISTALGSILPMMRDAGELDSLVGRAVVSSGIIGQFAPLMVLAIIPLTSQDDPVRAVALHVAFCALVAAGLWLARRAKFRFMVHAWKSTLNTGGQVAVRFHFLWCFALVLLALWMGVDRLIGAFAAGMILKVFMEQSLSPQAKASIDRRMRSVASGFFIPVFFVHAGVTFALPALLDHPTAFALIPVFLLLMLLVRGLPGSATLPRAASMKDRLATSLLVGTGLAATIVMAQYGLAAGAIDPVVAAAMMGAAKMSALVFPTLALIVAGQERRRLAQR